MQAQRDGTPMIAPSGCVAVVDEALCAEVGGQRLAGVIVDDVA